MKHILVVCLVIVGLVSFSEEVSPKARMPTLAQLRGNPRSRPFNIQGWYQAVKEAEEKFNCVFKPAYAYGVDGKWKAGEGKSYIFDGAGGVYLKFDENGKLVKAGNRGDFEEVDWTVKRAIEISDELQKKAVPKENGGANVNERQVGDRDGRK